MCTYNTEMTEIISKEETSKMHAFLIIILIQPPLKLLSICLQRKKHSHKASALAEEQLAVDGCMGRERHLSLVGE